MVSALKIKEVRKRDGRIAEFDQSKITNAIFKAAQAVGGEDFAQAQQLSDMVVQKLQADFPNQTPNIENIQDVVEKVLIETGHAKTAKAYILYRNERAQIRTKTSAVPEHVKYLVRESKKHFRNQMSEFVYFRTYSRWSDSEGRRETWLESVERYINFMKENLGNKLTKEEYDEIQEAVLKMEAMPSMRLLWSAGKAAKNNNVSAYNCSYIAPTKVEDFAEIMYLSMSGCGVGFSVETQTSRQLPLVKRQSGKKMPVYVVEDSKEGWCDALTLGLKTWYSGQDIDFDFSKLRPAGARLHTMGGRSSGPEPLRQLLKFARQKILASQGRRLRNIDVHDVICKIGEVVVMGGVRRTALISLSDLDDEQMRKAKTGQFYLTEPQRSMANNSAVYLTRPTQVEFLEEWLSLMKSGTGERGIFNRGGLQVQLPERRYKILGEHAETAGTNPCGEIILRNKQFCNLSEVVCRADDAEETLMNKMRIATILGTYQSTLTNFPYLSKEWKENCEEERLLGVSLTGQWDCPAVRNPVLLQRLRDEALKVNKQYSKRFGVNSSTCITCVKPSGTVSQLVDASSGMHARHSQNYIRRVRISATDPLFQMLKEQKFPYKPEVGQTMENATTFVLEFPIRAPKNAVLRDHLTANDQLEHWKMVKKSFCEHNPSVTISVSEDEWIETASWLYSNWEIIGGLSFLPRSNHTYQLAPYEDVSEDELERLEKSLPDIDFSNIVAYEKDDHTEGAKEAACVGGACEFLPNEVPQKADSKEEKVKT
ncbi:MAG TPA: ATP cone domain-containing protein [Candidatus Nanoarchaeia archaeon]|uniref:Ribonucleoside-triphosphate reductase n=1 Tax=Candidatus Iainarchaeum sp. TaxID=3101447 RepID=A0A8T4L3P9_9ARCH|nr:ribonucleoside-triphosphate reductase [Candidatus Diapherotrites archaeon]HLD19088.1 ATP cone domain-containing protein [Candidatus Nanoarchaeia archaeon]